MYQQWYYIIAERLSARHLIWEYRLEMRCLYVSHALECHALECHASECHALECHALECVIIAAGISVTWISA